MKPNTALVTCPLAVLLYDVAYHRQRPLMRGGRRLLYGGLTSAHRLRITTLAGSVLAWKYLEPEREGLVEVHQALRGAGVVAPSWGVGAGYVTDHISDLQA